jgi:hypothetical protein
MQKPDPGDLLRRNGSNAASVFQKMSANTRELVNGYLARIVKGVSDAETKILGSQETVEFRQAVKGHVHMPAMSFPVPKNSGIAIEYVDPVASYS